MAFLTPLYIAWNIWSLFSAILVEKNLCPRLISIDLRPIIPMIITRDEKNEMVEVIKSVFVYFSSTANLLNFPMAIFSPNFCTAASMRPWIVTEGFLMNG